MYQDEHLKNTINRFHQILRAIEYSRAEGSFGDFRSKLVEALTEVKEIVSNTETQDLLGDHLGEITQKINTTLFQVIDSGFASQDELETARVQLSRCIVDLIDILSSAKQRVELTDHNRVSDIQLELENELHIAKERRAHIEEVSAQIDSEREYLKNEKTALAKEQENFEVFKQKLAITNKELDFHIIAKKYKAESIAWLIFGAIILSAIIVYLCKVPSSLTEVMNSATTVSKQLNQIEPKPTYDFYQFAIIETSIRHLVMLSIFITALVFCIKNYNARMHNYIVNMHRSAALNSTISLLNTAKSDEGNDQILVQSCQAIFSHQKSGFSGKDGDVQNPNLISHFVEKVSKA